MAYYPTTPGYNPVSVPLNNGTFGNYQNGYAQSNYGSSMGPYQQPQNWYPNMYGAYGGSQTSVNNQNMKWVQGRAGAEAYQLEPNSRAVLFDSESQTFYIKEVGPDGRPQPLMVFKYEAVDFGQNESRNASEKNVDMSNYVTKTDFDQLKAMYEDTRKMLEKLTSLKESSNEHSFVR